MPDFPGHDRYLAVVPAYNEAGTVARVVEDLHLHAPTFDVVVVDDGSTDDTADRAARSGAQVSYARTLRVTV